MVKKVETFLSKGRKYVFLYKDGKLLEAEVWIEGGQKCTETNLINGNGTVRFFDEMVQSSSIIKTEKITCEFDYCF